MHGQLVAYRVNFWAVIFNVVMLSGALAGGFGMIWVYLMCIALNGSLATYHKALYKKRKVPVIEPAQTTAEMCSLWEIRRTQLKMLDAGIIEDEDISTCSDDKCPSCVRTRETQEKASLDKKRAEYYAQREINIRRKQKDYAAPRRQEGYEVYVDELDEAIIASASIPGTKISAASAVRLPDYKTIQEFRETVRMNMIDARPIPIPPKGPGGVVTRCSDQAAHQLTGGCSCYRGCHD